MLIKRSNMSSQKFYPRPLQLNGLNFMSIEQLREKEQLLSLARINTLLAYCPTTGVFTWKIKRKGTKGKGSIAGRTLPNGYQIICIDYRDYRAHRLAWFIHYGEWPIHYLDHINGCPADNRIVNLRNADDAQNSQNTRKKANAVSGYKGVRWHKVAGKWQSRVKFRNKEYSGGFFSTVEEAGEAARQLREKLHGEFANHE